MPVQSTLTIFDLPRELLDDIAALVLPDTFCKTQIQPALLLVSKNFSQIFLPTAQRRWTRLDLIRGTYTVAEYAETCKMMEDIALALKYNPQWSSSIYEIKIISPRKKQNWNADLLEPLKKIIQQVPSHVEYRIDVATLNHTEIPQLVIRKHAQLTISSLTLAINYNDVHASLLKPLQEWSTVLTRLKITFGVTYEEARPWYDLKRSKLSFNHLSRLSLISVGKVKGSGCKALRKFLKTIPKSCDLALSYNLIPHPSESFLVKAAKTMPKLFIDAQNLAALFPRQIFPRAVENLTSLSLSSSSMIAQPGCGGDVTDIVTGWLDNLTANCKHLRKLELDINVLHPIELYIKLADIACLPSLCHFDYICPRTPTGRASLSWPTMIQMDDVRTKKKPVPCLQYKEEWWSPEVYQQKLTGMLKDRHITLGWSSCVTWWWWSRAK